MSRHPAAPAALYKPGDKVQVWQPGNTWSDGIITSYASYGGGYYYQYDPLPPTGSDGYKPSSGGWTCDTYCRTRPVTTG